MTSLTQCDVLVIVPITEEFEAVSKRLGTESTTQIGDCTFHEFSYPAGNSTGCGLILCENIQTDEECRSLTDRALRVVEPTVISLVGIAGGLSDDVKLGDVVISRAVNKYLYRGKAASAGGIQEDDLTLAGKSVTAEPDIVRYYNKFPLSQSAEFNSWQRSCAEYRAATVGDLILKDPRLDNVLNSHSQVHIGDTASGPLVVGESSIAKLIKRTNRHTLSVDMESGGFLEGVGQLPKQRRPSAVVLRGISDHRSCELDKSELDRVTNGLIRRWAVLNAIELLLAYISDVESSDGDDEGLDWVDMEQVLFKQMSQQLVPHLQIPDGEPLQTKLEKTKATLSEVFANHRRTNADSTNYSDVAEVIRAAPNDSTIYISGTVGTGKSTLLSTLYLDLADSFIKGDPGARLPLIVDLHKFARHPLPGGASSASKQELDSHIRLLGRVQEFARSLQYELVLILDGCDRDMPYIEEYLEQLQATIDQSNVTVSSSRSPDSNMPSGSENINRYVLSEVAVHSVQFKKIVSTVIASKLKDDNGHESIVDHVTDYLIRCRLQSLDLWTISLFCEAVLTHPGHHELADVFIGYCNERIRSSGGDVSKDTVSRATFERFVTDPSHLPDCEPGLRVEFEYLYAHSLIRYTLIAYYVLEHISNWTSLPVRTRKSANLIPVASRPYPFQVNMVIKSLLKSDTKYEEGVFEAIRTIAKRSVQPKDLTHLLYLAGRISDPQLATQMSALIDKFLESHPIDLGKADKNELLAHRTLMISSAALGNTGMAWKYVQLLMSSEALDEINRGFHLEYYGDIEYSVRVPLVNEDKLKDCPKTLRQLYHRIMREEEYSLYPIEVYTFFSLIQQRHAAGKLKTPSLEMASDLADRIATNHRMQSKLRNYVDMVTADMKQDFGGALLAVRKVYSIKGVVRRGWIKNGVKSPETVASHSYACYWLAKLLLTDERCAKYGCDREDVCDMLLVHDIAEASTGDLLPDEKGEVQRDQEYSEIVKLSLIGTYRGISNCEWIEDRYARFTDATSDNANIARDIDRIENLYQACEYFVAGEITRTEWEVWVRDLRKATKTDLGNILFSECVTYYDRLMESP